VILLPAAASVVCLQLANVLSTEALFYTCIIPFICFFGAFAFVFYPLRDVLHPTGAHTPTDLLLHACDGCHS
jgi:AAA family ATP:ADP antiporter